MKTRQPIPGPQCLNGLSTADSSPAVVKPPPEPMVPPAVEAAAPPVELSLAGLLAARVQKSDELREQGRAAEQERLWSSYRRMVSRDPQNTPSANELETFEFLDVCAELGVTPEQVGVDVKLLQNAREQTRLHGLRDEHIRIAAEKRTIKLTLRSRQEEEAKRIRRDLIDAEFQVELTHAAAYELEKMARSRPMLFDLATPPRLRED